MRQLVRNNANAGAGIYCIKDSNGVVRYVGSSINLGDALTRHKYKLKNGLYGGTSKDILQNLYDTGNLYFNVLHVSANNSYIKSMTKKEKECLLFALSYLEEFYINLYKDTICNKQMHVSKSSSKGTAVTYLKRRSANLGSNNPNSKISEALASSIVWLRLEGYKPKEIQAMLIKQGISIGNQYISKIGIVRWTHVPAVKPMWFDEMAIKRGA